MPLKNESKSSSEPSKATKSSTPAKTKSANGDSLRNELHGMIPDIIFSNGPPNEDKNASSSSSSSSSSLSSTPSDDESGVFDTRFDL